MVSESDREEKIGQKHGRFIEISYFWNFMNGKVDLND